MIARLTTRVELPILALKQEFTIYGENNFDC